jgi:hypothetical protein
LCVCEKHAKRGEGSKGGFFFGTIGKMVKKPYAKKK